MSYTVPSGGLAAITPSDATVYNPPLRAILVGGAGAIAIQHVDGSTAVLSGIPAGTVLNLANVSKVLATGTTATLIAAWTICE